MIHILTDVPVHSQKRIAAEVDTNGAAAHGYGPEHCQHVCASKADCDEVGIFDS
jgi:hypothetical protein